MRYTHRPLIGEWRLKIRIFALAKELNLDSKDLIQACNDAGLNVKSSPLASISPEEKDMVKRLTAGLGRLDENAQIVARRLLSDELVKRARTQCRVGIVGRAVGGKQAITFDHAFRHNAGVLERRCPPARIFDAAQAALADAGQKPAVERP